MSYFVHIIIKPKLETWTYAILFDLNCMYVFYHHDYIFGVFMWKYFENIYL